MKVEEVLRSINNKDVEFIHRMVKVEYDNKLQCPLKFVYQKREYKTTEVLGIFKGDLSPGDLAFLVKAEDENVYLLYLHFFDSQPPGFIYPGYWILNLRVLRDEELMFLNREERKMLVNMQLKRMADFHGHLCPDLIIGCRACEMALEILSKKEEVTGGFSVIAENNSSALDAIQCITGCTLGNRRLVVYDSGKHKYTFIMNRSGFAVNLSLKEQRFGDEKIYFQLEEKILKDEATIDEVSHFRKFLDDRVKKLLSLKHDDLFETVKTRRKSPRTETPTVFSRCSQCGDMVLKSKLLNRKGSFVCKPCFEMLIHIPSPATYN